jgi:hypothetical protein
MKEYKHAQKGYKHTQNNLEHDEKVSQLERHYGHH